MQKQPYEFSPFLLMLQPTRSFYLVVLTTFSRLMMSTLRSCIGFASKLSLAQIQSSEFCKEVSHCFFVLQLLHGQSKEAGRSAM